MSACPSHQPRTNAPRNRVQARARFRHVLAAFLACMTLSGPGLAQDGAGKPAVLMAVVDGSGSMWGALGSDGHSKLTATREALETVLPRLAGSTRLGLATFGPGCRSATVAVAADGASGAEAVTAPLVKFNPRGKGPLGAGLKVAADAFGAGDSGMIVLFHDGLDNCGEDQCAIAAAVAKERPGLKISTISLDMEPAQVAAIGCVAKATGGRAFAVEDRDGVVKAMEDIALLVGGTPTAPAAAHATPAVPSTPAVAGAPGTPPVPAEVSRRGPSRLVASARLATGGPAVSMPLSWRVSAKDGGKVLHEAVAPTLAVELPAGAVHVEVRSGRIVIGRDVEIAKDGDSAVDVVLNAGIVRFDTGAKRLASDAEEPLIRLEQVADGAVGAGDATAAKTAPAGAARATPLWIARGKAIEAMLPPGSYRAVAEYGLARVAAPVLVRAGEAVNLSLPLEAGRLELSSVPAGLTDVVYRLEIDDPDRAGGKRELTRTAHAAPAFVLSTGTYYVTAFAGGQELRRLVTVRSGEVTREAFKIEVSSLEVSATVNGAPPGREPLVAFVRAAGDGGAPRDGLTERQISFGRPLRLLPGVYRVQVRQGLAGASAEREVKLAAGAAQRIVVDLKTAQVALDLSGGDGSPQGALCELKSATAGTVWRTVEVRPSQVVAPGQYTLSCRSGETIREYAVTAAAGQVTRVAPFAR